VVAARAPKNCLRSRFASLIVRWAFHCRVLEYRSSGRRYRARGARRISNGRPGFRARALGVSANRAADPRLAMALSSRFDALSQAEEQVKSLSADIQSMEAAEDTPSPHRPAPGSATARQAEPPARHPHRKVRPRASAANRVDHPVAAETRSREALLSSPFQILRPRPAGCGRRFELLHW
jgi:hypothetical protein